jgi:DNA-binding NarL/FixJ family response regulator
VRVLIVDDQQSVRRGIRALLLLGTDDIEVCGEAENGHEAVVRAAELKPDVILMDVRMPVVNGFQATREIRRRFPDIQVVVLSHYDLPYAREHAIEAGAFDYVEKSAIWMKLLPALRRLQTGVPLPDPDLHNGNSGNFDL